MGGERVQLALDSIAWVQTWAVPLAVDLGDVSQLPMPQFHHGNNNTTSFKSWLRNVRKTLNIAPKHS